MVVITFSGLVLVDEARERVLLLKRSPTKKLHPNRYSVPGGKVEPGEDARACIEREVYEEVPCLEAGAVTDIREHLVLTNTLADQVHVMHWFSGVLRQDVTDMESPEGVLEWFKVAAMPLPAATMTAAAFTVIPFVLGLEPADETVYRATLEDAKGETPWLKLLD